MSWWDSEVTEASEASPELADGAALLNTRSSVENGVMTFLNDCWGNRTAVSWSAMNVNFDPSEPRKDFEDNDTFLIPSLVHFSSDVVEYPATDSAIVSTYSLALNLLTSPNSGMGHVQEHVEKLRTIFELKSLSIGDATADFELIEAKTGFLSSTGDHWETPVSVLFTAIT
jgi:hypothetical protein